jgi:hypothetical protein
MLTDSFRRHLLVVTLGFLVGNCNEGCPDVGAGLRPLPARTSPAFSQRANFALSSATVFDFVSTAPTWYDFPREVVVQRLVGGVVTRVQDRPIGGPIEGFRVFEDNTIAYVNRGVLHVFPGDGGAEIVDSTTFVGAFDGSAWNNIWYVMGAQSGRTWSLCHRTAMSTECVANVPVLRENTEASDVGLVVARDRSVYVSEGGGEREGGGPGVFLYANRTFARVGSVSGSVRYLRPGGSGVILVSDYALYTLEGSTLRQVVGPNNSCERLPDPIAAVGSPERLTVVTLDGERETTSCSTGLFGFPNCLSRLRWSQLVISDHTLLGVHELGHLSCVPILSPDPRGEVDISCNRRASGVWLDGDDVVIMEQASAAPGSWALSTLRR